MGFPVFPEQPDLKLKKVLVQMLESITLEELAIAHLINAEAEKVQAFVGGDGYHFPTKPSTKEIIEFQATLSELIKALSEKQKTLVAKMELIKQFEEDKDDEEY